MKISKEREEEFERMFNGYVMKIIERQYWKFIKRKKREEQIISLNTLVSDGLELIDVLRGESDSPMEFCDYKELEMLVEDYNVPIHGTVVRHVEVADPFGFAVCGEFDAEPLLQVGFDPVQCHVGRVECAAVGLTVLPVPYGDQKV